jgi:membrane protein implicated in regulation of membrane protease activity
MDTFIAALPFDLRYLWLLAGAVLLALEAAGASGIGFMFAGLAALLVGVLIEANIITETNLTLQLALWFTLTVVTAIILFSPLKRWRTDTKSEDSFDNIIGTTATVAAGGLMIGKPGRVQWSGTVMNAQVVDTCQQGAFLEGDTVTVCAIKGNQLIVCANEPNVKEPLL